MVRRVGIGLALFGLSVTLIPMACSADTPPPRGTGEPIDATREELSDPVGEKLIPLRFINLLDAPGSPDNATYQGILRAIDAANEVFKAAGIQFWLRSIERYYLPNFVDLRKTACGGTGWDPTAWELVRDEMKTVFPDTDLNASAWIGVERNPREWMRNVNLVYGKGDELVIWIPFQIDCQPNCNECAYSGSEADGVVMGKSIMNGAPYTFAHELGHFFGLPHTWVSITGDTDPQTLQPFLRSNLWDLVYKPGNCPTNPHTFFKSRGEAAAQEASLVEIDTGSNCALAGDGTLTCTMGTLPQCVIPWVPYTETHATGSEPMKGLGFQFGIGKGPNVMTYYGTGTSSGALSDSQIEVIRKYIRWDRPLSPTLQDNVWEGGQHTVRKPRLGAYNTRDSGRLGGMVDFDGDNRRDIAYWIPPTVLGTKGTFKVLLSSQSFSTAAGSHLSVAFGELGDVPAIADFGCALGQPGCTNPAARDGKADLAIYQPGGGFSRNDMNDTQGWWRWCPTRPPPQTMTNAMCDCSAAGCSQGFVNCGSGCERVASPWGLRRDVALPGLDFLGTNVAEVAVYRPDTTGLFAWREAHSSSPSGPYRLMGTRGSVPLQGDYDYDFKTDLAIYDPYTGVFRLSRSEQNWDSEIQRTFPYLVIPQYSQVSAEWRSGAVVLEGAYRFLLIGSRNYRRRVPALWYPGEGSGNATWYTFWNVLSSSTLASCGWGIGRLDAPLSGIDRDNDGYSDLAVYRADGWGSTNPGWFHFKTAPSGGCGGASYSVSATWWNRIRTRTFVVADMTGDSKPEIMGIDPDTGTVLWLRSDEDYTMGDTRSAGTQRAVFF